MNKEEEQIPKFIGYERKPDFTKQYPEILKMTVSTNNVFCATRYKDLTQRLTNKSITTQVT